MGNIRELARTAFRDHSTDGVPSSGAHEPLKSEIRATFDLIDAAYAAFAQLEGIGSIEVIKASTGALDSDLDHGSGTLAAVINDNEAAAGIYEKSGSSGSGSWTLRMLFAAVTSVDFAALEAEVDALADDVANNAAAIAFHETRATNVASSSTTNIATATGEFVQVTGTATITSFGAATPGTVRHVRFTGAGTITHNATTLILPGGANIIRADNDTAIFRSIAGDDGWICISYKRANGRAIVETDLTAIEGDIAALADDVADLGTSKANASTVAALADDVADLADDVTDLADDVADLGTSKADASTVAALSAEVDSKADASTVAALAVDVDSLFTIKASKELVDALEDDVETIADAVAVLDELKASKAHVDAVETDLVASDAAEATARAAGDAHLAARITASVDGRPGDDPDAFGMGVNASANIDPANIVVTAEGKAVRLSGEVVLATRTIFPLERGEIYRLDHRLWRSTNTDDEAGDAVTVSVRWLDKDGAYLSTSVLDTYTALLVGPVESRPHFTSRVAGPQIDITPPLLARGFRLTVQHRGTTPRTDISLLRPTRITGGTASLDLAAVEARVDALEAIRPVSSTATVLDDDVLIIEPPSTYGAFRIVGEHANRSVWADAMFTTDDNAAGAGMTAMVKGADVTVLTAGAHMTAGYGVDGRVTIACDFSGAIRISNRRGATLRFAWTFSPVGI